MNNIRLICFDLDDTLWPCMPTITKAEAKLYQWLQVNKPEITSRYTINELRHKRTELARSQPAISHNLTALRKASLHELANEFNEKTDWIDEAFKVFYEARQNVIFYDDVEPVLNRLNAKFSLAAMTNGNADIGRTSLGFLFDHSISAEKVGAAKPDPLMFQALIEQAGVKVSEVLCIGDHPVHDIEGAHNIGISNVWLNRQKLDWPHDSFRPDHTVQSLYEILALLGCNELNPVHPSA
ncbi:MAG: HAD family hydrolase [Gammaproteobacteria bacterium]|nr:HAD family hydrolase [Gammaproteobacteria bacterium]